MQESLGGQIAALSGVDEVAQRSSHGTKELSDVYGSITRASTAEQGFLFRDGRPFEGPDE